MTSDPRHISELADAATPGPWEADGSEIYAPGRQWVAESCRFEEDGITSAGDADAAFIAAARSAVPALVAKIAQVEALARAVDEDERRGNYYPLDVQIPLQQWRAAQDTELGERLRNQTLETGSR